MSTDDPLKTVKEGVTLVGEIIKAAGDNPQVKEAGSNLGHTALTLTKAINNALLPLAAINFAFDKARAYFTDRFQQDIREKTAGIPQDSIIEPKASIAGPMLQGLAFTHEEPRLKDMYLSLLATAMDERVSSTAHPAFVEIIKQLDAEDADLIRGALRSSSAIPIVQLRLVISGSPGYHVLGTHLLDLREGSAQKVAIENPRVPALIDNWCRLGLVEVDYTQHITTPTAYDWVDQRPELIRLRLERENESAKVTPQKGILIRTNLGLRFASAVGLV